MVSEIAASLKDQLAGVEQVNKAVSQMDRVTQGNASQTEELSGTAAALLSHAVLLKGLVRWFKLEPVNGQAVRTLYSSKQFSSRKRAWDAPPLVESRMYLLRSAASLAY